MNKRNRRVAWALFTTFVLTGMLISTSPKTIRADEGIPVVPNLTSPSHIAKGFLIAPVPLNFKIGNQDWVGEGSYIVNAVAGCNDCHTCPSYKAGHNPYTGGNGKINSENYLAGGVPFGPFTADNITPDANGLPAGMTIHDFVNSFRTGHEFHPEGGIVQVMPWPAYRNMTYYDLYAIYQYLRAIPPALPGTCTGAGQ